MIKKNKMFTYREKGTYIREIRIVAKTEDEAYEKYQEGHPSITEGEADFEPQGRPELITEK